MSSPTAKASAVVSAKVESLSIRQSTLPASPPQRSSRFTIIRANIPKDGIELFERAVKSQPIYYQDSGYPLAGTCIKLPVTGLEEEPATRVNPVIGITSGFLPKCSSHAQRSADGPKVDTLYTVFVDCNTDILQDDYTEVEMKEKKCHRFHVLMP